MGKNKKRLQMQTKSEEKLIGMGLEQSVALGIVELVGYEADGEPLYQISLHAAERIKLLRKASEIDYRLDE